MEPTDDELNLFSEAASLGDALWEKSRRVTAARLSPLLISKMLFQRLRSNFRGFALLWKNREHLEADILLRSALEGAICLAANAKMEGGFVTLMRRDAAHTIKGQIKILREAGDLESVRAGEATYRGVMAGLPAGTKPAKLDFKSLAEEAGVAQLYGFHRSFSGLSAHVTGLSILRGLTTDGLMPNKIELGGLQRRMHFNMICAAMIHGSTFHAKVIDDYENLVLASGLGLRMAMLSMDWPHVQTGA